MILESENLRGMVYTDASLNRVLGMIRAYLQGRKNCTMNWIVGQITKAHNLEEAKIVLDAFNDDFTNMDSEKLRSLKNNLSL